MNSTTQQTAVAYYRTSSATNVGDDKDSRKRQQDAVLAYANARGLALVGEYYDAAVSGADPVMSRPGFAEMLSYMLGNGARIVLVENASRFARDLAVQIAGHDMLRSKGISLVPVDAPTHFEDETPTATMVRSILGAVSQFEKEALVLKLRKARDRVRREKGRCEGNPAWVKGVRRTVPAAAVEAALAAQARGLSLRQVAAELAAAGLVNANGRPFAAQSIKRLLST
jgi:DNA invertase Pin-like site-specific DNA recombinase